MKKSLITKAMSIILSVGLVACMFPTVSASAKYDIHTAAYGSETAKAAPVATLAAYEPSMATIPAETTVPAVTTALAGTTTEYVTTTTAQTQLTEVHTGTSAITTAQTVLRTTRTRITDEFMITCTVSDFLDGAYIGFERSLKNVYMIIIEYPEIVDQYGYEAGLRFDVEYDGEQYQVIYPLNILSYNSKEGSYSTVCVVNDFSYATVRYGDTETTVSALDVVDSMLCDKLYDALIECNGAVLDIKEKAPSNSETTAVPSDKYYVHVGESVTVPVYYDELPAIVESVTRDDDGSVFDITKTERMNELINIHILGISEGESLIRITCIDRSVLTIPVKVLPAETTAPNSPDSTATAVSDVPVSQSTTASSNSTTCESTTVSFYAEYPIIMVNRNYTLEGEYVIPADDETDTEINVEVSKEGVVEVVSAETVNEDGMYKYTVKLHGIGEGATEVVVSVYDHKFYFLVTVENENGQGIYDLNRDGKVDLADATYVLDIYTMKAAKLKVTGYTRESLARADVDGDGSVTLSDATAVLTYYAENAANLK